MSRNDSCFRTFEATAKTTRQAVLTHFCVDTVQHAVPPRSVLSGHAYALPPSIPTSAAIRNATDLFALLNQGFVSGLDKLK